jgi:hypothetical protein
MVVNNFRCGNVPGTKSFGNFPLFTGFCSQFYTSKEYGVGFLRSCFSILHKAKPWSKTDLIAWNPHVSLIGPKYRYKVFWRIDPLLSGDSQQRTLLGNVRNSRTTGLCIPFLRNGFVNTPTTIGVLLETVLSIRPEQSGYKEDFSWESAAESRSSKWAVSWELCAARKTDKMALWV